MKKIVIIVIGLFVSLSLAVPPALAGSKQRHRWEGAAIAVGAAALGGALLGVTPVPVPVPVVVNHQGPNRHRGDRYANTGPNRGYRDHGRYEYKHDRDYRSRSCGRWEVRRVWVPAAYERVWNPGHYNRRNEWVTGCWIQIETGGGYWTTERVWISGR